jgi:hypothetical protein
MIYSISKCIRVFVLTFVRCRKSFTNINKVVIRLKCIHFTFLIFIFGYRIHTFLLFLKLLKLFWLVLICSDIQLPAVLSLSVKSLEADKYLVYDFRCLLVGLHL